MLTSAHVAAPPYGAPSREVRPNVEASHSGSYLNCMIDLCTLLFTFRLPGV